MVVWLEAEIVVLNTLLAFTCCCWDKLTGSKEFTFRPECIRCRDLCEEDTKDKLYRLNNTMKTHTKDRGNNIRWHMVKVWTLGKLPVDDQHFTTTVTQNGNNFITELRHHHVDRSWPDRSMKMIIKMMMEKDFFQSTFHFIYMDIDTSSLLNINLWGKKFNRITVQLECLFNSIWRKIDL